MKWIGRIRVLMMLLPLVSYVGSYCVMVGRVVGYDGTTPGEARLVASPKYNVEGDWVKTVFQPVHWLDRQVRPSHWQQQHREVKVGHRMR